LGLFLNTEVKSNSVSANTFLSYYCIRPLSLVNRFVSYKDVNHVDADFLSYQMGLLDWGALCDTLDVDLQVSLVTDFVDHLYGACFPVRWKFVPDPKYPWMTLAIRVAIRRCDRMRTGTVAFRSSQRQIADMMNSAFPDLLTLPQRVLWFSFRRLGFCNSSNFSSLGVGVEDFVGYFAHVPVPSVQMPTASELFGGFSNVFQLLRV
jgi:hypothetical protein